MPLYWTIDSRERLFIGVGEGEVTIADAMLLLQRKGAVLRKLLDGRAVQSAMTSDELLEVSAAPGWTNSCRVFGPGVINASFRPAPLVQ
jgi:hypothetical protein